MTLLQSTPRSTAPHPRTATPAAPAVRRPWRSYRRLLRGWLVAQDLLLAAAPALAVAAFSPTSTAWVLATSTTLVLVSWLAGTLDERVLSEATSGWRRVLVALPVTVMLVLVAAQVLGLTVPREATLIAAPFSVLAMVVGRALAKTRLRATRMDGHGLRRTLVVVGQGGQEVLRGMRQHPGDGFLVVGAVTGSQPLDPTSPAPRVLGAVTELHELVVAHDVDVVITVGAVHPHDQRAALRAVEGTGARFIMMPGLSNVAPQRLHQLPSAAGWTGAVEVDARRAERWGKRLTDMVVGALLTLVALPIIGVAALAVKATDHGPAFYTQTRVGKDGLPFTMYKLRSMYVDADARRAAVLAAHADSGEGNEVLFKSADDPRITPVGKVIRRLSIDELPQIFNVLLGDMSLIGPRPALPEEVAKYDSEALRRLLVRPGMTGLWQVSGRSDLSWERSVELDQRYVDNSSTLLDLHITAATVGAVLGGKGAY